MNRIGDLGMLIGIVLIIVNFGSIAYADVFATEKVTYVLSHNKGITTVITLLLFVGAMGKSAQIPLYTWLPDAMAGPTPVSALIHAATMVTAGIYMIARNNILYTVAPFSREIVIVIGLATAIFAATIAIKQNDIKKVLAYSTVSQLGLMFVALGLGAYTSGIFHMATHAFFKALLFLGAGSVIHALHNEQDIRNMGGLKKYLPITYFTFLIGVLAISGIPPFAGFFSKDEILAHAFEQNKIVWGLAAFASLLTAFYMFRLFFLTFYGKERASHEKMAHIHESPKSITFPLIVLAILSAAGGFIGVPEALHGSHWLSGYLAPVFSTSTYLLEDANHAPLSHMEEYLLMGGIVGLTIILIIFAYVRYAKNNHVPVADDQMGGVQKTLANKYYVDEIYNAIIVKPLFWLSGVFDAVIEKSGIDKLVNTLGNSVIWSSRGARFLQTGSIGFYIFMMVLGIVAILVANSLI
jgi:NADH-quinone oxidoreductase subunit L